MRTVIVDGGGSTTDVAVAIDGHVASRTILPSVKPSGSDLHTDELCRMLGTFLASTSIAPDADATSPPRNQAARCAGMPDAGSATKPAACR